MLYRGQARGGVEGGVRKFIEVRVMQGPAKHKYMSAGREIHEKAFLAAFGRAILHELCQIPLVMQRKVSRRGVHQAP